MGSHPARRRGFPKTSTSHEERLLPRITLWSCVSSGARPRSSNLLSGRVKARESVEAGIHKAGSHRSAASGCTLHGQAHSLSRGADSLTFYPFQVSNVYLLPVSERLQPVLIEDIPPAYELWVRRTDDLISRAESMFPESSRALLPWDDMLQGMALETRINRMASHLKARCSYTLKGLTSPPAHFRSTGSSYRQKEVASTSPLPWQS